MITPAARFLAPLILMPLLWLCSCSTPGVASSLPARLDRQFLSSNLQIEGDGANGLRHSGSAVLIGPRLLATAKHVWSSISECSGAAHRGTKHTTLYWPTQSYAPTRMRLVCEGQGESPLDDWVLIEPADVAEWPADADACVAHILPQALWKAQDTGPQLWLTGYTSTIGTPLPPLKQAIGDDDPSTDMWISFELNGNTEDGPWVITGQALEGSPLVRMRYNSEWEPPFGASGGGMWTFNPYTGRAELAAMFVEYHWNLFQGARLSGVPIWHIMEQHRIHNLESAAVQSVPAPMPHSR